MMKIAEELAQKRNALALATGDALGQVASQTLQNLSQIEKGVNLPVLRPLITLDKNEIISKAKKIGTYETSILPHDDSCVLFASKSPTTKAAPHVINDDDSRLNSYELIFRALDSAEKIII
jgi:thiamine biosynthesis protein ThiI